MDNNPYLCGNNSFSLATPFNYYFHNTRKFYNSFFAFKPFSINTFSVFTSIKLKVSQLTQLCHFFI